MERFWNKRNRLQRTLKYWQKHQRRWEKSGKTQAEYCREQGISLSSFSNWRVKLGSGEQESSHLIEVQPKSPQMRQEEHLELVIPEVGILRIPETANPEFLKMILLTLKGKI